MLSVLLLSAAEIQSSPSSKAYQRLCMNNLCVRKQHGNLGEDVCAWSCVTRCDENGFVHRIGWNNVLYQVGWKLEWLPTGLEILELDLQVISAQLETRLLPRSLKICSIQSGKVKGSLDLTTLPDALENLDLNENYIQGEISLLRLPPGIKKISLTDNPIKYVYVCNGSLPKSLSLLSVTKQTPAGRTRAIEVDGNKVDKRIYLTNTEFCDRYRYA